MSTPPPPPGAYTKRTPPPPPKGAVRENEITARGILNAAQVVGTGAATEMIAGVGGLGKSLYAGPEAGGRFVEQFKEQERPSLNLTPEGQAALAPIANVLGPVSSGLESAGQSMGNAGAWLAQKAGGGEKLQAAGYAAGRLMPDLALTALGGGALVRGGIKSEKASQDALRIGMKSADEDLATKTLRPGENPGMPSTVVRDPIGEEAIRQGFKSGLVQAVKVSSVPDKAAMREMLNIYERGQKNLRYSTLNRPADVMGGTIRKRVDLLREVNHKAGRDLRVASENLKGQTVDYTGAIDDFVGALQDMGVHVTDKGRVVTKGSDIEGLTALENGLNRVVTRMWDTKTPDAYDVHRLKKYIDENVGYGRLSAEGLSGKTEAAIKRLRHNLNESLKQFPEYADANMRYADTVGILKEMQQLAGMKTDITELSGDRAFGRVARKVFSNYQSRDQLVSALENLDGIAKKYGGQFDDDVVNQALFVQEMERRFGSAASASFQDDIEKAVGRVITEGVRTTVVKAAADKTVELVNRMRGVNDEAAVKSLRDLLETQ